MELHRVDAEPASGVQPTVTDCALEVLRLLVVDEDLFVFEFAVAVPGANPVRLGEPRGAWKEQDPPAPRLRLLLGPFLLSHGGDSAES